MAILYSTFHFWLPRFPALAPLPCGNIQGLFHISPAFSHPSLSPLLRLPCGNPVPGSSPALPLCPLALLPRPLLLCELPKITGNGLSPKASYFFPRLASSSLTRAILSAYLTISFNAVICSSSVIFIRSGIIATASLPNFISRSAITTSLPTRSPSSLPTRSPFSSPSRPHFSQISVSIPGSNPLSFSQNPAIAVCLSIPARPDSAEADATSAR